VIDRLLHILNKHGIPQSRRWAPGTFYFEANRRYDSDDLSASELLIVNIHCNEVQFESSRDPGGRLILLPKKLRRNFVVGRIYPNYLVVSDKVMKLLAGGGFLGLRFNEVITLGGDGDSTPRIWELTSSIVLPKMSNTHRFRCAGGPETVHQPFQGDYTKVIGIDDPPYRAGEPHYLRSDIKALGAFDVALTFEKYLVDHQALVVSQRFYQFCEKNGIPLGVSPIRIDG
jgi:hypothetical protein